MDSYSHEHWPVRRLAGISGMSAAYFARSFQQAFGIPPHRYLLSRRIERAKAMLRDTDLEITVIALETGWNSLGTFCRVFRTVTGESPTSCRTRERLETQALGRVPACYLCSAQRPNLTRAVLEKRRSSGCDKPVENSKARIE